MARPSNTRERRLEILAGMESAMAELGYDGASVAEVARRAGLAPGLLHYHFASKEEILAQLVRELSARVAVRWEALAATAGTDPQARLEAFLDAHLARGPGADPRAVRCWVLVAAEALRRPEIRRIYEDAIRARLVVLEGLVADVLRAAGRPTRGARAAAAGILATIEGSYQLGTAAKDAVPPGFAAPAIHALVAGLLGASGPRPGQPRPRRK
jgi:TetR/AcrR family transcriptional repressor of bet genes